MSIGKKENFILSFICVTGTLLIIAFALGLENKGSWAEGLLKIMVQYKVVVLLGLTALGVASLWPLFRPKKNE